MKVEFTRDDYNAMLTDIILGQETSMIYGYAEDCGCLYALHTVHIDDVINPCITVYNFKDEAIMGSFYWDIAKTSYRESVDSLRDLMRCTQEYLSMQEEQ